MTTMNNSNDLYEVILIYAVICPATPQLIVSPVSARMGYCTSFRNIQTGTIVLWDY